MDRAAVRRLACVDGRLELGRGTPSSVEDEVDVVRAACAAAWAAVDAGVELDPTSVPELATALDHD